MTNATVAIITRTKNRPITLKRAIESVSNQTFRDYIHIIVNDGGDPKEVDQLVNTCDSKARQQIQVIHNPLSVGMEAASNIGIRSCDSKYILIHDDDDSLYPEFLRKTVAFIETNGTLYCGVSSWISLIKEVIQGDTITTTSEELYSNRKSVNFGQLSIVNRFVPIAFLYKRCMHDIVGYYDESLPVLGDWDFYLRLLERQDIGILPEVLARYHRRSMSDDIYANTLTSVQEKHELYTQIIRNRIFRKEMQTGKPGTGFLCQIASLMQALPSSLGDNYVKKTVFQVLSNRPENVAIYGTGQVGTQLFYELKHSRISVKCFIENGDNLLNKKTFLDTPVLSLQEAVSNGCTDIVIGSMEYNQVIIDRIHNQLNTKELRLRLYSA